MVPDLWNNLPAAILRSRLPIHLVPIHRGRRYAGKSKMNFTSLIVHGLSGISVYADTIFVRLLILSVLLVVLSVALVTALLLLRIFVPTAATAIHPASTIKLNAFTNPASTPARWYQRSAHP